MTKETKFAHIDDIEKFGESYIGSIEIMGFEKINKNYKGLKKEVESRSEFKGKLLLWDMDNGKVWIA